MGLLFTMLLIYGYVRIRNRFQLKYGKLATKKSVDIRILFTVYRAYIA